MQRVYVVVQGQVQGVGFRYFVQRLAVQYHLTGWVRNMTNGMVEMELQGEEEAINQALRMIRAGDRFIKVYDLRSKIIKNKANESKFSVHYY